MVSFISAALAVLVVASFAGLAWLGYKLMQLVEKERAAHRGFSTEVLERYEAFARHGQEETRAMASEYRQSVEDLTSKIKAASLEEAAQYQMATRPPLSHVDRYPAEAAQRRQETLTPEEMERMSADPDFLALMEAAQRNQS